MSKIDERFLDYSREHRTRGNQRTHLIGIPLIVVSVLSFASHWAWWHSSSHELPASLVQLDCGVLIVCLVSLWYAFLDWKMAMAFFPVLLGTYWIGRAVSLELAWIFFGLGWVFQFIGHGVFEKRSPAFLRNLQHLLIGPIWIFVKYSGIRR